MMPKRRNIRTIATAFFLSLTFLLASCGEAPKPEKKVEEKPKAEPVSILNKCKLNMGWDPWEPYQYLSVENQVRGLEIDLVGAIAEEAGCELNFVQKNWMNLLNGIRNGSIDLLGGATKTEAREQFAYFSDSYRSESFILYVRTGESDKFSGKSLKALLAEGFRLGVTQDYIYGEQVSRLQDDPSLGANFVSVPTTEVNYFNLTQNNIDGFLEDPFVAAYTIRRKGLQDKIQTHPLEIHSGDVSIMFSKKSVSEETVNAFNMALTRLKQNGKYQEILNKYSQ